MLKFLHLEDYRCFKDTKLEFKDLTIAVGKNNAGKSTIIEALRIISYALSKPIFRNIPDNLARNFSKKAKYIIVNGKMLKINTSTIPHNYDEDSKPKLTAGFHGGYKIIVHFHDDLIFALVYDSNGKIITNKTAFNNSGFPKLNILPQIGPLRKIEKYLSKETVRKDKDTYLSSLHFRNEIYLEMTNDENVFNEFSSLINQTWKNLHINPPKIDFSSDDPLVSLVVGENEFMTELGYVGNGLQMWLQMMWFVTKSKNQGITTVILDEPDVYMHPDLQRKLLKYVRRNFQQVIIATHSIEIISEVDSENILNVSNKKKNLKYTNELLAVQKVVDEIGSIQNMSLIRLFTYKKLLFLEGDDMWYLKKFFDKLYPESDFSIDHIFSIKIKGFSNFEKYFKVADFFKSIDGKLSIIGILDRDYYPDSFLSSIKQDAEAKEETKERLKLHIWTKKEIENYLLIPEVLFRISKGQDRDRFYQELEGICETFREETFGKFFDKMVSYGTGDGKELNSKWEPSKTHSKCQELFDNRWKVSLENKMSMINGKDLKSEIYKFINKEYHQNCTDKIILKEINREEVHKDIENLFLDIIDGIEI